MSATVPRRARLRPRHHRRLRRLRRAGDRGAVLVEFALVLPLISLLVLGVVEYGTAWNDVASTERAVLGSGRVLSNFGNKRQADQEGLLSLSASLGPGKRSSVEKVIVYKANTSSQPPSSCLNAPTTGSPPYGVAGLCNVYTGAQVRNVASGSFSGATCSGAWDARWCPTTRVRAGNPDRVGIWVQMRYSPVTGLLPGGGVTVTKSAVYQLEPPSAGES